MLEIMENWTKPDGKMEIITECWGDKIPDCLWYYIGESEGMEEENDRKAVIEAAKDLFDCRVLPGEIEIHRSTRFGIEGHAVLRVKNPAHMLLSLDVNGVGLCPLYQVGLASNEEKCIWFVGDRKYELMSLLLAICRYDEESIRAFMRQHYRRNPALPGESLDVRELALAAVNYLEEQDLINIRFFERLSLWAEGALKHYQHRISHISSLFNAGSSQ